MDWIHNLLFITDRELNRIEVGNLTLGNRKVIVHKDINKPIHIVVSPKLGLVSHLRFTKSIHFQYFSSHFFIFFLIFPDKSHSHSTERTLPHIQLLDNILTQSDFLASDRSYYHKIFWIGWQQY